MTREMRFKEVVISLGFWEDADAFGVTDEQWREWLYSAVKSWHHKTGPHMSVASNTRTQIVMDEKEIAELLEKP